MAFRDSDERQVRLLLRVLPMVAEESFFARKGGTGINLFVRAMPRLPVDIDPVYLPIAGRPESLAGIDAAMCRTGARNAHAVPGGGDHAGGDPF